MCQILMDGWKLVTLADLMVVVVVEWHNSWKWIVSTKLQLNYNELDGIALYVWQVTTLAIDATCSIASTM